jgi:predicted nucleic acid-binding protein
MKIAITDANIFIDLIKLQWLGYLFCIDVEIYTTVEVINELIDTQLERVTVFIKSRQLNIYSFSPLELEQIIQMTAPASLTTQDKSVVFLAKNIQAGVLSGDNPLRKFCEKQNLEVKGIIWLFDQFLELQLIECEVAIQKMNELLSFNNRLPVHDCNERLRQWKENAE